MGSLKVEQVAEVSPGEFEETFGAEWVVDCPPLFPTLLPVRGGHLKQYRGGKLGDGKIDILIQVFVGIFQVILFKLLCYLFRCLTSRHIKGYYVIDHLLCVLE